jgi:hypothetical protein
MHNLYQNNTIDTKKVERAHKKCIKRHTIFSEKEENIAMLYKGINIHLFLTVQHAILFYRRTQEHT